MIKFAKSNHNHAFRPINLNLYSKMRKNLTAFLGILVLFYLPAFSQQASIKGTITDTSEHRHLANAVISLLNKKDSVLVMFTRSNKEGGFHFRHLASGRYIMMVSYPGFADYADELTLGDSKDLDLKTVPLTPKSVILKEVIVKTNAAIRLKGDTTEFTADSFHVKEGATVEELLKVIPGFTVNKQGQITAQGKQVDKVLVDGEEFFGDDPTIATQNLSARIVDKVQVYDTKTQQDNLKGIGGGNNTKTINIKLKDNAKKGYFGKLEAGANFNQYHDAKALFNRFQRKKKISFFGTKSTTTTGSLGWEDRNKLGIENDYEYDEISGYYNVFGVGDDFNNWSLQGLPNAYSAGALFSNKWNADKNSINLSYKYNRLATSNINSTLEQTLLKDTTLYNNTLSKTNGLKQQHIISGKYEWKIDSLATLTFKSIGTNKTSQTYSTTHSDANSVETGQNIQPVNTADRTNSQDAIHHQLDNLLTYNQRFRKKDRQLIATMKYSVISDDNNGMLYSKNQFYRKGILDSTSITDQYKTGTGDSRTFGLKVTYNEPLTKYWNLVTEYSYNNNNSTSHRNTYDKDPSGKYTTLDSLYSNNFGLNAFANTGTLTLRYVTKKLKTAFGGGISAIKLQLHNLDHNSKNIYNFTNFTPQAQVGYEIRPQRNITFRYNGNTRQPTLDQLQPLRNNNDPLNIIIGNPNLKVGFTHTFNLVYNSFKMLSGQYMYVGGSYNLNQNAIAIFRNIDSFGKVISMPINVNGTRSWYTFGGWVSGQGDKKFVHEINGNINGGRNVTFINGQQSINNYGSVQMTYGLRYLSKDKYYFSIRPSLGRNISRSSLRKDINNDYWTYGGQIEGYLALPWKMELNSDINFDLRQKISAFDRNTNITVWNASLNKKVFKDKSGKFIFSANDILNQNKGYSRIINSSFVTDSRYQKVGQYFMLTFQWAFNKMPATK